MKIINTNPLLRMDEYLDSLGEISVFSALDATPGYQQMPIPKSDRDKASFKCIYGLYQFSGMPFGLSNTPKMFQMVIDMLLTPFRRKSRLVYRDDVIIFRHSWEEHMVYMDEILSVLEHAGVKPKLCNCKLVFEKTK